MRKIFDPFLFIAFLLIFTGIKAQNVEWSFNANSKSGSYTPGFTLDKNNNLVFLEYNSDTTILLGDTLFSQQTSLHVYKVDKEGSKIWRKDIVSAGFTSGGSVTVDNENNIYVTGRTGTDIIYIDDLYYEPNDTTGNAFLWKMDSDGNTIFLNFFSAPVIGFYSVKADRNLNTYVCGAFEGALSFMDTTLHSGIIREDEFWTEYFRDFFIAKFDMNGDLVFFKKLDGSMSNSNAGYINDIELDSELNIYAAGTFRDSLFIEDHNIYSSGNSDMFLIKWDNDGNLIWVEKDLSEEAGIMVSDLNIDKDDYLYVTGEVFCDTDFGDVSVSIIDYYADAFIVKYDNTGKSLWAETLGATAYICSGTNIDFFENGDVCWQGTYVNGSQIEDTILNTTSSAHYRANTFMSRIDNQGSYNGVFTINSESGAYPRGVQIGESDTLYVMESFVDNITYNDIVLNNKPAPINGDLCLIKFSYENEIIDTSIFNISDPFISCGGTERKITLKIREEYEQFGTSVGFSENIILACSRFDKYDVNEENPLTGAGSAYFLNLNESGDVINYQKVTALDRDSSDYFGDACDLYGNYAIIAARGNDNGAAYIYEKDVNHVWVEKSKLVASDSAIVLNYLGTDVCISDKYAVASNEYAKIPSSTQSGAIYIYQNELNGAWTEMQRIYPSDGRGFDFFGKSVDIDSDYVIVGSPWHDYDDNSENYIENAGAAYIYINKNDIIWEETQKLVRTNRKVKNNFGVSVALDGNWAIIGASWDHRDEFEQDSLRVAGAAYMFEKDELGVWREKQKLVAFDRTAGVLFGYKVDIYDSIAVVHAWDNKDENGENNIYHSSSVYLYKLSNNGYWDLVRKIVASDRTMNSTFGRSVKIWGNKIVVGDQYNKLNENGSDPVEGAGAIYVIDNEFIEIVKETINICKGDSLFLEGVFQTSSGIYYDTLQNYLGCDSIIETTVNVLSVYSITETSSVCSGDSYEFPDGTIQHNITSQVVHVSNLQTILGCDSIIETTVNVHPVYSITEASSVCSGDSYEFPDGTIQHNITSQVVHVSNLQTILGCDSIIETTVNVLPVYSITEASSVCSGDSYEFPDGTIQHNITSQVVHASNLQTILGCDSIIETTVNVYPVYSITETFSVCSGDSYEFPDGTTQDNIISQVVHASNLQTILGCDSIIETTVNVYPVYSITETFSVCSGDSYEFPDGTTQDNITSQVVHASNLQTILGCDSIIETTVNVYPVYNLAESISACSGESYTFPDGTTQTNITSTVVYTSNLLSLSGCDSIIVTTVTVDSLPIPAFTYIIEEDYCMFTNNSSFAESYTWDFGDGVTTDEENPWHIYATTGEYIVKLSATNNCGVNTSLDNIYIVLTGKNELNDVVISVYPNPAKGVVNIDFDKEIWVEFYSLTGLNVLTSNDKQIDISGLQTGTYVVLIKNNKKEILKELKLIIGE